MFRDGARSGNLRCMKDLADYGAKLGIDRVIGVPNKDLENLLDTVCKNARVTYYCHRFITIV